jgi:ankyrin repeat protein
MSDFPDPSPEVNLEYFRKLAKKLLRKSRAGDPASVSRIRSQLSRFLNLSVQDVVSQLKLVDVQHALAREQGCTSWAELKKKNRSPLERFLAAVRGGSLAAAKDQFEEFPGVAKQSIYAASAIGDADALQFHLSLSPSLATAECEGWPALLYACASPFSRLSSRHAASILQCASVLLDRGADPNSYTLADASDPESKVTASFRAAASGNIPLFWLLLHRGASPVQVSQSIAATRRDGAAIAQAFKSTFDSLAMRELMAKTRAELKVNPSPPTHMTFANYYNPMAGMSPIVHEIASQGFKLFLKHGVRITNESSGPDAETPLHRIAVSGHSLEVAATLLKDGADPNATRADGRTPYELAVRNGNKQVAELLRSNGAGTGGVSDTDKLLGACMTSDTEAAKSILGSNPDLLGSLTSDDREMLIQTAGKNMLGSMRLMANLGFDLAAPGKSGATALHVSAWHGHADMVRLLLEFHAPVNVRDTIYGTSPLGWAAHGSINCRNADDDYCATVAALLNAGADSEASINPWGVRPETVCSVRVGTLLKARGFGAG